ncbi:Sue1p Ecym_1233 [Eremothecium cymbalariae DBVPG|uniref:Uncharacterized protein n=1 Tax=Eremothecium cymbalariae (strain CBS 270.75 / DBVPG 7215 / KCTC 17166 / NRRL Y-17582) TaxID=931890 RepID=G8JN15_ERECY|nr:hypothetical protein Ecym_1233 [Eremothecium cymbalariae DBVPG\
MVKGKPLEILRHLPRVPTTQYLSLEELRTDIFFSGYRPMVYPVKQNPLFRSSKNILESSIGKGLGRDKDKGNAGNGCSGASSVRGHG